MDLTHLKSGDLVTLTQPQTGEIMRGKVRYSWFNHGLIVIGVDNIGERCTLPISVAIEKSWHLTRHHAK